MKQTMKSYLIPLFSLVLTTYGYTPAVVARLPVASSPPETNPFKSQGLDIELPDFESLFKQIQEVSPLAKSVIQGTNHQRGLAAVEKDENLSWKRVESNKNAVVSQIDKLDNYKGRSVPMMRFRSSIKGKCVGEYFGKFIIDVEERKKWDSQIQDVYEMHQISDLDSANIAMGFGKYGDCARLGLGYAQTKAALGISPREQFFVYGVQDFADGSSLIWGHDLQDKYNYLLPEGPRQTRAKSHLFSACLTPTGEDSFDVEYALQLDVGGNLPKFLTVPVMIETVKSLFFTIRQEFTRREEELQAFLHEKEKEIQDWAHKLSLMVTI